MQTNNLHIAGQPQEARDVDPLVYTAESAQLPDYIVRFLELSDALDREVRRDVSDAIAITRARNALRVFYLTLDTGKQEEIRSIIQRDAIGATIEDGRGKFFRGFVRTLEMPHRLIGAAAEPVAKLCGKTIELIVLTLGWTVRGAVEGATKVFRRAA